MTSDTTPEISRLDLKDFKSTSASITDIKHLSSYNWIEAPTPTICVPGCPSLWSPSKVSKRLKKDSGLVYIAQNAARHPESPLEPLFRALYLSDPTYDIRAIDIVSDRNNIRKLLSFINPSSTRNGLEPFTIGVEVTGNIAVFCREETATTDFIAPHEFKGFGHEFEKANTVSQIEGSTGHHRIISYRFGDLSFIVRYEADGYVTTPTKGSSSTSTEQENNNLSNLLESLSLTSTILPPKQKPTSSKLTIREGGKTTPLSSTLEIKTRISHRPLPFPEIAPQLWLSQTTKLVRAYHTKGVFQIPEVEDVGGQIWSWEEGHREDLGRLAGLIKRIVELSKGCGGRATLRYDERNDRLTVRKAEGRRMLPADLYSKWEDEERLDDGGIERKGAVRPVDKGDANGKDVKKTEDKHESLLPSQGR
jgi:hypothetical protein